MMWRYFNILQFSVVYLLASHVQASDNIKDIQEEEGRIPSISTSTSHAAADQLSPVSDQGAFISTVPQVPIIKFKHFDYDPNTQTFHGGFFDEAGHIINQVRGYYIGKKYDDTLSVMKDDLIAKRASLEENKSKKSIKGKEKDEGSGSDLESYKRRKQQKGEILLKEAEIELYQDKAIKYQQLINILNQAEQTLQQLFYVEMFMTVHRAKYSGDLRFVVFNACWQDLLHSESIQGFTLNDLNSNNLQVYESGFGKSTCWAEELKKERKTEINPQELKKSAESFNTYIFSYATLETQYRRQWSRVESLADFKMMKKVCSNPKFSKNEALQEFAATFIEVSKEDAINKIRNLKKRDKNEIRPLAAFYHRLIEVLSGFRSEVESKEIKRT